MPTLSIPDQPLEVDRDVGLDHDTDGGTGARALGSRVGGMVAQLIARSHRLVRQDPTSAATVTSLGMLSWAAYAISGP